MCKLLEITAEGPVRAEYRMPGERLVWTVQPENFPNLIAHVNKYGGPLFWRITEINPTTGRTI